MPLKLKRYLVLLVALILIKIPVEKQGVVVPDDIYYQQGDKYYVLSNGEISKNELSIYQIINKSQYALSAPNKEVVGGPQKLYYIDENNKYVFVDEVTGEYYVTDNGSIYYHTSSNGKLSLHYFNGNDKQLIAEDCFSTIYEGYNTVIYKLDKDAYLFNGSESLYIGKTKNLPYYFNKDTITFFEGNALYRFNENAEPSVVIDNIDRLLQCINDQEFLYLRASKNEITLYDLVEDDTMDPQKHLLRETLKSQTTQFVPYDLYSGSLDGSEKLIKENIRIIDIGKSKTYMLNEPLAEYKMGYLVYAELPSEKIKLSEISGENQVLEYYKNKTDNVYLCYEGEHYLLPYKNIKSHKFYTNGILSLEVGEVQYLCKLSEGKVIEYMQLPKDIELHSINDNGDIIYYLIIEYNDINKIKDNSASLYINEKLIHKGKTLKVVTVRENGSIIFIADNTLYKYNSGSVETIAESASKLQYVSDTLYYSVKDTQDYTLFCYNDKPVKILEGISYFFIYDKNEN